MSIHPYLKPLAGTLAGLALVLSGGVQSPAQVRTAAHPSVRVTAKVNNAVVTRLAGTHPAFTDHAVVGQGLASSTPMSKLHLVLSSSDDQLAALRTLAIEQQDKTSANYHKWLTPDQFGQLFGAASSDISTVSAWLQDQGFSIDSISKGNRIITFSGTSGQVEAAFHTQMSQVTVDGVAHRSNTTDIAVPSALAGVVVGVARLNDVYPTHGSHGKVSTVQLDGASTVGTPTPLYGSSATGTHYIAPGDAAVIYNTVPLTSAGIDGTGQTVAVLAQSNINVADVQKFRSMFGLSKNDPIITVVDSDPGENGDDTEAFLDAEWGGALAPGATVNFIVSSPNYFSGGVDSSALYAVENNIGDIISLSYGGCEFNNGATYTGYWNTLWEQAAAQGQTAFVSSGDSGAAGCASSSASFASVSASFNGYSVNSLGSSAYNVAVGGSIFVDWNPAQYWSGTTGAAIPFTSALSYIPEAALNQGRLTTTELNSTATAYVTGSGIFAAGGGISIYTARPAWQTGSGIPTNTDGINVYDPGTGPGTGIATGYTSNGSHRLVPDLVNISANGHVGTLFCASSLCSTSNAGGLNNAGIVGGTSVATPVQAGIQALINQKNGGRQGNILPVIYKLASTQYAASTTACQAPLGTTTTSTPTLPASSCNFHDVIGGSITVPTASSGTAGIGFSAGAGFDEASGLGSMNVATVATNWSTVSLVATTTAFTLTPTIGITHGATQNLKVTVSAASGAPTGDIALVAESTTSNGPRVYTLTAGTYNGYVGNAFPIDGYGDSLSSALPAGNYKVHVHYGGDTTYSPSDSPSIVVSIGKESTAVTSNQYSVNVSTTAATPTSTFAYGGIVYLATTITPASGNGVPTGTVTYAVTRNGTPLASVTGNVDPSAQTYFYAGAALPNYYLKPNYSALLPGSYVVTVSYSGDSSFNASSTTNTFVVTQATPTITFTAPVNINSGANAVLGFTITNSSTAANPNSTLPATGTVTFTDTTTASALGSCTLSPILINGSNLQSASCSLTTAAITASGANNLSAVYSGDANYATATGTAITTVGALTASTLTLTASGTATVGAIYTLRATMSPTAATGTVAFYDGATYLGQGTLASGLASLALGTTSTGGGILTAGTHSFSAAYSGSTTYSTSTGTLSSTIAKAATGITLSAPGNSTYGQNVIFSVYLTRTPTSSSSSYPTTVPLIQPTGVVNFLSDGILVATGTPAFDPAGYLYYQASGSTTTIGAGTHTITATYVGDSNFLTSTSTLTPTLTVAMLTPTVTLSSTATVYASGSSVTLTATIPLSGALAAPTGGVTFYDGATALTTVTPTYSAAAGGYVATYTTSALTNGTHALTAVLAGDTNYSAASGSLSILLTTNNVWVANGNGTVSGLTASGGVVTPAGVSGGGTAVAIDNSGNIWSLNKSGSKVAEYSSTGAVLNSGITGGGITSPTALAIDGAGYVWITNGSGTLSVLTPAGAPVNTAAYQTSLSTPTSVNVDSSGSLWITNAGDNSVTEVIGVATPVTTPTTTAVKNSTLAAKP